MLFARGGDAEKHAPRRDAPRSMPDFLPFSNLDLRRNRPGASLCILPRFVRTSRLYAVSGVAVFRARRGGQESGRGVYDNERAHLSALSQSTFSRVGSLSGSALFRFA